MGSAMCLIGLFIIRTHPMARHPSLLLPRRNTKNCDSVGNIRDANCASAYRDICAYSDPLYRNRADTKPRACADNDISRKMCP